MNTLYSWNYPGGRLHRAVEVISKTYLVLLRISENSQQIPVKAGFTAEEIHAMTYNLNSILNYSYAEAYTDRHECFYEFGFNKNGPSDIVIADEYNTVLAQVKYYSTAYKTSVAMREIRENDYIYNNMQLIAPSNQIIGIQEASRRTAIREMAKKRRLSVVYAAEYVYNNVSDRISHAHIQSEPLDISQARDICVKPDGEAFKAILNPFLYNLVYSLINYCFDEKIPITPNNLFQFDYTYYGNEFDPHGYNVALQWVQNQCKEKASVIYSQIQETYKEYGNSEFRLW